MVRGQLIYYLRLPVRKLRSGMRGRAVGGGVAGGDARVGEKFAKLKVGKTDGKRKEFFFFNVSFSNLKRIDFYSNGSISRKRLGKFFSNFDARRGRGSLSTCPNCSVASG